MSIYAHSLGSVISHDLLSVLRTAGEATADLALMFEVDHFFAIGSPLAAFLSLTGKQSTFAQSDIVRRGRFFNVFHPYDPISYRLEPLLDPNMEAVEPQKVRLRCSP